MHGLQLISPADYEGSGEVGPFLIEPYPLRFLAQGDLWFSIGAMPPWKTSNQFDKMTLWLPLSAELVGRVGALIQSIAASEPTVHVVKTQGTLTPVSTQDQVPTAHWHNEIHPSKAGCRKLGDVWEKRLKAMFC